MIRVVATDAETGEVLETTIRPGQYVLLVADPCHLAGETHHRNGTTVLTLKGVDPAVMALARGGVVISRLVYVQCDRCFTTCGCGSDGMRDTATEARRHVIKRDGWKRIPRRQGDAGSGFGGDHVQHPGADLCPGCAAKAGEAS